MLKRLIPENMHSFYFMVAGSLVFYVIGYFLSFIASILITRTLGPEGRGLLSSVFAYTSIGATLAQLGMGQINKKLVAENKDMAGELFLINVVICLCASIVVIPFIYLLGKNPDFSDENRVIFFVALAFIPISAIYASCGEILVGMHHNRQYNYLFILEKTAYMILIMVAVAIGFMTPLIALIILYISQFLRIALCCFFLRENLLFKKIERIKLSKLDKNFIAANYASSICFSFSLSILPILLNRYSSLNEVGFFAGTRIMIDALMILSQVQASYSINKLITEKKGQHYQRTKRVLLISSLICMTAISAFLYITSGYIIPFIFGSQFIEAIPCFRHMLPVIVFLSGYQVLSSIFLVEGKAKNLLMMSIIYALSIAISPFIISPQINAVTSADSMVISSIIIFSIATFLNKDLFFKKNN